MQTVLTFPESIVDIYGVNSLTFEDHSYFQSVFSNLAEPTSDYWFANNFMWINSFRIYWKVISHHLCIYIVEGDCLHMFLPPCPEADATPADLCNALHESFRIMNDYNVQQGKQFMGTIQYVSDEMLDKINRCGFQGIIAAPSPMGKDYIYDMEKMITLSGSGLDSKRHARNKFIRQYPDFYTQPITSNDIKACIALLNDWYNHKGTNETIIPHNPYNYYLDPERIACELAITSASSLDLKGMALFVKDEMVGFTYGEALSPTQASILIEKTHPDYYGAPAVIFSEFCRQYWSQYPECNAGDHGSSPNLRFTKEQYRPIRFLNKSVIMQTCPKNLSCDIAPKNILSLT